MTQGNSDTKVYASGQKWRPSATWLNRINNHLARNSLPVGFTDVPPPKRPPEDGRVKVNASDTLDFLEDQCQDHNATAQYDATYDTLIDVDTVSNGGDPKLRWFIDASAVTGYATPTTDATSLVMVLTPTGWQMKTPAQFINLLPGYTSGNDQSIGHDASGSSGWQDDGEC